MATWPGIFLFLFGFDSCPLAMLLLLLLLLPDGCFDRQLSVTFGGMERLHAYWLGVRVGNRMKRFPVLSWYKAVNNMGSVLPRHIATNNVNCRGWWRRGTTMCNIGSSCSIISRVTVVAVDGAVAVITDSSSGN